MASTSSFGTQYLPMSAYELVDGVMVPKATAPVLATVATPTSGFFLCCVHLRSDTDFLLAIGLSESKAKETLQNAELTADLKAFVSKVSFRFTQLTSRLVGFLSTRTPQTLCMTLLLAIGHRLAQLLTWNFSLSTFGNFE